MKKILTVVLTTTALILPTPSAAQEHPGCFMVDGNQNLLNLNSLCIRSGTETAPGVYQIPIKARRGGTPVIEVTFNGSQTTEMLFDTGATRTLIEAQLAASLQVAPFGTGTFFIADGNSVEMGIGRVKSITVGGLVLQDVIVAIAPPQKTMGLLGQDFFGEYDITIKQNTIELRRRSA